MKTSCSLGWPQEHILFATTLLFKQRKKGKPLISLLLCWLLDLAQLCSELPPGSVFRLQDCSGIDSGEPTECRGLSRGEMCAPATVPALRPLTSDRQHLSHESMDPPTVTRALQGGRRPQLTHSWWHCRARCGRGRGWTSAHLSRACGM